MGKPLEMYVVLFPRSMVRFGARNVGFTTKILFRFFCILSLGALVAESPQEGAIQEQRKEQDDARSDHHAAMSERLDSTPLA